MILIHVTYVLEKFYLFDAYVLEIFSIIEVKAGTNSHLRSLHSFDNNTNHHVTAIRFWSGELLVQDANTPAPENKPYRLINIPFYYISQLQALLRKESLPPI